MDHPNGLAGSYTQVRCPLCDLVVRIHPDSPRELFRCLGCPQMLDPGIHEIALMAARSKRSMERVSPARIKRFLGFFACMAGNEKDLQGPRALIKGFPEFFPLPFPTTSLAAIRRRSMGESESDTLGLGLEDLSLHLLMEARDRLRRLWGQEDGNWRDWSLIELRKNVWELTAHPSIDPANARLRMAEGPPPEDAFQQAILYFQAHPRTARHCAYHGCNLEEYFFARRPNQRYCSGPCSASSRKESKRKWWDRKGNKLRAARRLAKDR
jgi:hypothetical protein